MRLRKAASVLGVLTILGAATTSYHRHHNANVAVSSRSLSAAGSDTTFDFKYDGENNGVRVAWIMGYPHSGVEYVVRTVRAATPENPAAAAAASPYYVLPTNCGGGGGSRASPEDYATTTPPEFLRACLENARFTLDRGLVERSVRLVRNPLDNVVERFRSETRTWTRDRERAGNAEDDDGVDAFARWCAANDAAFREEEARVYSAAALRLSETIPCHAEFFRYVLWHNNAVAVVNFRELRAQVVHYGSFRVDLAHTVTNVLKFLRLPYDPLPPAGVMPPFEFFGYVKTYYTDAQRYAIGIFLREFAVVETWAELERYFPGLPEKAKEREREATVDAPLSAKKDAA